MDPAMAEQLMGAVGTFGLPVVLIVVFYFVLVRPQRKKDKEVKNMLANLKVGDRITTIGGIYGSIASIKDDIFTIAVGQDKVKIVVARWAIRALESTPEDKQNDVL
jgi:preprotein translocase subunit YajC